jgi:hypothetical protein
MRILIALTSSLLASFSCIAADARRADGKAWREYPIFRCTSSSISITTRRRLDRINHHSRIERQGAQLTDIGVHDATCHSRSRVASRSARRPGKVPGAVGSERLDERNFTQAGNSARVLVEAHRIRASRAAGAKHRRGQRARRQVGRRLRAHGLLAPRHAEPDESRRRASNREFVIVGKKVNNLPVDLLTQDGAFLRVESHEIGINFEGRFRKDTNEISGTCQQGPFEVPLVLHRETGNSR